MAGLVPAIHDLLAECGLSTAKPIISAARQRRGDDGASLRSTSYALHSLVTTGHSRSKNGVASLAYDPVVHAEVRLSMDCRIILHEDGASRLLSGNDERRQ